MSRARLRLIETEQRTLADPDDRIARLERFVADLQRQILERPRQPRSLQQGNDARRARADRLDKAIGKLLAGHPRAAELTARQIREALAHDGFSPLPAERTVRLHLAKIRGNGNADGVAG